MSNSIDIVKRRMDTNPTQNTPLRILSLVLLAVATSCTDKNITHSPTATQDATCSSAPHTGSTIVIPAGAYHIGDERFYREEGPIQIVELAAFDIDATEVTNRQFREFADATGYITRAERGWPEAEYDHLPAAMRIAGSAVFTPPLQQENINPMSWWKFVPGAAWRTPNGFGSSIEGKEDHPVVHVAFEDAFSYADWKGRRLPTEAEWEAAARGDQQFAPYQWGDNPPTELTDAPANTWQGIFPVINENTDGHEGTAPSGCYPPNSFGLYDMIGNVWEMTSEEYFPNRLRRIDNNESANQRPSAEPPFAFGAIKGGSYLCSENYCIRYRPAARQPQEWAFSSSHIGFRTAKSVD